MGAVSAAARERKRRYDAQWRRENPEKVRATEARYLAKYPEKARAKVARARSRVAAWQQKDRETRPESYSLRFREWYEKNRERSAQRQRDWRARNPEALQAQANRRRAAKANAPGDGVGAKQWREAIASYCGLCAHCARARQSDMDHVDPLSSGGAHDITNVVPACSSCNTSKNNTTLVVWLAKRAARGRIRQ